MGTLKRPPKICAKFCQCSSKRRGGRGFERVSTTALERSAHNSEKWQWLSKPFWDPFWGFRCTTRLSRDVSNWDVHWEYWPNVLATRGKEIQIRPSGFSARWGCVGFLSG